MTSTILSEGGLRAMSQPLCTNGVDHLSSPWEAAMFGPGKYTDGKVLVGYLDQQLSAIRAAAYGLSDEQARETPSMTSTKPRLHTWRTYGPPTQAATC